MACPDGWYVGRVECVIEDKTKDSYRYVIYYFQTGERELDVRHEDVVCIPGWEFCPSFKEPGSVGQLGRWLGRNGWICVCGMKDGKIYRLSEYPLFF